MLSGRLFFQSLCLSPMMSLPVVFSGVSCSVRLCCAILSVSRGLHGRGVWPAPILKCFLFVLLQCAIDCILDQSPADPQQLRLVGLGPTTPTWVEEAQQNHIMILFMGDVKIEWFIKSNPGFLQGWFPSIRTCFLPKRKTFYKNSQLDHPTITDMLLSSKGDVSNVLANSCLINTSKKYISIHLDSLCFC